MGIIIYLLCGCIFYGFGSSSGQPFELTSNNWSSEKLREFSESDSQVKQLLANFICILTIILTWPDILFRSLTK
jgi:hypothetical protein